MFKERRGAISFATPSSRGVGKHQDSESQLQDSGTRHG